MKKIKDFSSLVFIFAVLVLAVVSILGVWNVIGKDSILKSFETMGLLAVVAVIVLAAGSFMDSHKDSEANGAVEVGLVPPNTFSGIRRATISTLITAVSIVALFGVLAIWDIVAKDVLYKTFGSITVLAFSALVMVMTCLEREGSNKFKVSGGGLVAGAVVIFIIGYSILIAFL